MPTVNPVTLQAAGGDGWQATLSRSFLVATADVRPPVAAVPAKVAERKIVRVSQYFHAPTSLNEYGRPASPWTPDPDLSVRQIIGRLRIIMGKHDITYFRDAETIVEEFTSSDPYGDATCEITLPQVSPLEEIGEEGSDTVWLQDHRKVDIRLILNPGIVVENQFGDVYDGDDPDWNELPLFHGMMQRLGSTTGRPAALRVFAIGALYQLDYYIKPPFFEVDRERAGARIKKAIIDRAINYGFRGQLPHDHVDEDAPFTRARGSWDRLLTGYVSAILAQATLANGQQMTVMQRKRNIPVIRVRGDGARTWTVRCWSDGVDHDLDRDYSEPNTFYGSGIDTDGCRWANLKMPGLSPQPTPAFPLDEGEQFTPGGPETGFAVFAERLRDRGRSVVSGDTYDPDDENNIADFQDDMGLDPDGTVGAATWRAAFEHGQFDADYDGWYKPLARPSRVDPFIYNIEGGILDDNPDFDPNAVRIEDFRDYGQPISKATAREDAKWRREYHAPEGLYGTITLTADPREGWRGLIRAGDKIELLGYQGSSPTFHIAAVRVARPKEPSCSVALTVDTKARDILSLSERLSARRASRLPKVIRKPNPNSKIVVDSRIIWECENDAGHIGPVAMGAESARVFAIPAAERGTFAGVRAHTESSETTFCIALFARRVTAAQVNRILGGHNPLEYMTVSGTEQSPWDHYYDELIDAGWIDTWGGPDNPGGYAPYPPTDHNGDESPVTGRMIDDGQVAYWSEEKGRVWAWVWCEDSCDLTVRIRHAPDDF